jgi:hypothetical protein
MQYGVTMFNFESRRYCGAVATPRNGDHPELDRFAERSVALGGFMTAIRLVVMAVLFPVIAYGQEFSAENPLDRLKRQVSQVLSDAKVPFTQQQERELALFIEEQKQASEDLFGVIMDFTAGPPQGQDRDRAIAGIQWMHDRFLEQLPGFLTVPQRAVWEPFQASGKVLRPQIKGEASGSERKEQIQEIRINNNPFTTEEEAFTSNGGNGASFGGVSGDGNRTLVIQRGGTGEFHGNLEVEVKDESLNARNPFADNKPPYQERTVEADFSGPLLRNRLTVEFGVGDNRQEDVGTVKVETLDGPFSLGITRPTLNRSYEASGLYQLSQNHSLRTSGQYETSHSSHEGVGNFTLPERGSTTRQSELEVELHQFSVLSPRSTFENIVEWSKEREREAPVTSAVAINVLDAFRGGGAQDREDTSKETLEFENLFIRGGESWTVRTGVQAWHRRERSLSEDNFLGEFTFSSLDSYRSLSPRRYRVNRGNPLLEMRQTQLASFVQNDWRITPRFTFMFGARYQWQTNLDDNNNIDPRVAFAYAVGRATVIRVGAGVFHQRLENGIVGDLLLLDGQRQFEIVIDNPSYPDPFQAGSVTIRPPSSRRVRAPELEAPYNITSSITLQQSLPKNLFVSVAFDYNRGVNLLRSRNLNAPLPGTGERPFPDEGHIYQLESTAMSTYRSFQAAIRQRFSIFRITANYTLAFAYNDADSPFDLPSNNYDLRADWGRSGDIVRHQFRTSVNSRLPLDVYLTTSITANSGEPYNITTGEDDNGDSQFSDRPLGFPRNSGVGPRFYDVSFNVSKAFDLGSSQQINFFANLDNAFNMTNLGTPSGVITSPFFGKSFSAGSPREIEAGFRYQF